MIIGDLTRPGPGARRILVAVLIPFTVFVVVVWGVLSQCLPRCGSGNLPIVVLSA